MNEVLEFFQKLGDTSDWPPRWHCGKWSDFHGWLFIVSDLLVWSAYFAIPLLIIRFITRKKSEGVRFRPIYFLFASFILLCGLTHFLDAITFWKPIYRIGALSRLATGIVSWTTVFVLIRTLPAAFSLKSPKLLEQEVQRRTEAEEALRIRHERMITAEIAAGLCHWTWDVASDRVDWSDSVATIFRIERHQVHRTFQEFLSAVHPDDQDIVKGVVLKCMATGQFEDFEYRIVLPDGRKREVRVQGRPIVDANGNLQMITGTLQDVTDHHSQVRRIEAQNRRLRNIASMQSHRVRGPLATILGLTQVIEKTGGPNDELLEGLRLKAEELDSVVRKLVLATEVRQEKN